MGAGIDPQDTDVLLDARACEAGTLVPPTDARRVDGHLFPHEGTEARRLLVSARPPPPSGPVTPLRGLIRPNPQTEHWGDVIPVGRQAGQIAPARGSV